MRLARPRAPTSNFTNNDIYEFSYTAKDPTVNGLGFAAVRDFNSFLKYSQTDDFGTPNPLWGHVQQIYTEISSQPGAAPERFPAPGLQRGRERTQGARRPDAVGGGRRRHQHELPLVANGPHRAQSAGPPVPRRTVPVRQPDDVRPDLRTDRRPLQEVRGDQHVSAGDGVLFVQRILGEARVAVPYGPGGQEGPQGSSAREALPAVEQAARRRRQSDEQGELPAVPESARFGAGAARAVRRSRPVGDEGQEAA